MKLHWLALAAASSLCVPHSHAAAFADAVIDYQSGTGFAAGLTDPAAALGVPSQVTPGDFGGPVDPFNPPYLPSQLVSLGTNGAITLHLAAPIVNDPSHAYGLDFIIHGSAGFIDTDWPNGLVDGSGSIFGDNLGHTLVSVSTDGVSFFQLNSSLAPVVDGLFPTDGQGAFGVPLNPALTRADFANLTLAQLRSLYAGSAGGTGYDLAWAQNSQGQSVAVNNVQFVRIDVLDGRAEIDAIVTVPEPAVWALAGTALGLVSLLRRRRGRETPGQSR